MCGNEKYDLCRELLSKLLDCTTTEDVEVLLKIDRNVLLEAVRRLKDKGIKVDFQSLYTEAVYVACEREGMDPYNDVSIYSDYVCAMVYCGNTKRARKLEKYGFVAVPYYERW